MKLYYSPGACSLAPHIALSEAGVQYSIDKVDLGKHQYSGGDFTKVNAKGSVPTLLLDNGQVLTEGAVIMQYIADQKPESSLIPKAGTMERYRAMEWLNYISSELHKGFSPLWSSKTPEEYKATAKEALFKRFDFLENHFKTNTFLMAGQFTVADGYLFTVMNWAHMLKMDLKKWPALVAYMERVKSRPGVQAAMKAEGLL